MALQAVLFGLAAALGFGVGDFYAAKVAKRFGGITASFFISLIGAVLFGLVYVVFMRQYSQYNLEAILYAIAGGAVFTLGVASFYKGIEMGPVSIVSPLGSTYPLVTTALLVLFGTVLSMGQALGVLLVVIGIVLAAGMLDARMSLRKVGTGPLLGLCAAVFWGCGIGFYSQSIEIVGWQQTTLVQLISTVAFFSVVLPLIRGKERVFASPATTITNKLMLCTGVLQLLALLAVNIGIGQLPDYAPVVVAVSALYPVLTVFLALRHLDEKISRPALIGAIMAVLGVVVLTLG